MRLRSVAQRRAADRGVTVLSGLAALIGLFALGCILYEVVQRGAGAIDFDFFTKLPTPPGEAGGGVANAIVGTLLMTALATAAGVPLGLLGGVYLAEFGKKTRFGAAVRFCTNVLMGTPSIIVGVFAYTLVVLPTKVFSAYAGALALAIIMLPVMGRTAEDILRLVPNTLRESALALGAPRWKMTLTIVFRAARPGLITGGLLAVARVSGETAPLLFTCLNSPYWMHNLNEPIANLTVTIFNYAMSPYDNWQQLAWGASLVITVGVLFLNLAARLSFRGRKAQ
jgi:phosphate transport system permease protein